MRSNLEDPDEAVYGTSNLLVCVVGTLLVHQERNVDGVTSRLIIRGCLAETPIGKRCRRIVLE